MSLSAEAIVVGAGPAGATAARALALAGVDTLVLDRARFPRHKPCGGAISVRALTRFPWLRPALDRIPTHWISRLLLETPSRQRLDLRSEQPAVLMIRRIEFDGLLSQLAREAGARLAEGADVTGAEEDADRVTLQTRDGRRFSASFVVAADGVHSVVARRLGIKEGWPPSALAVDMMEETPNAVLRPTDPGALWVSYGFPAPGAKGTPPSDGYAYVFPKQSHVNVGLGYVMSHYRESSPGTAYTLQRGLVEYLRREQVLEGESQRQTFTPALIPVGGPAARTERGRVLLAGDAGGFVHGFTAEGIYYAMLSGELAATSVAAARGAGQLAPGDYTGRWRQEVGAELRDSVLLQQHLFADHGRIEAVVRAGHRDPGLAGEIVAYAMGIQPYRAARRRVLASSPLTALQLGLLTFGRAIRAARH